MKKYLMSGVAAIAFLAAFTSCSKTTDLYDQGAVDERNRQEQEKKDQQKVENIQETYEQAFENAFGKPNPNHTWGFGSSSAGTRAFTRDGNSEGDGNTNRNQWGAIDGTFKLDVPDPLSPEQKERVIRYFQTHPNLTYVDPGWTNFFVQQVYKGATSVPEGSISTELYRSADKNPSDPFYPASAHMDKLSVGGITTSLKHVNDFNAGDFNGGQYDDVLNSYELQNNYEVDVTTHKDQITLMLGASTECVGYHESESSLQHNNCCALATAAVIDAWADEVERTTGETIGAPVTDRWNRSFVGLDYEQKPLSTCLGNPVKFTDFGVNYVKYQNKIQKVSDLGDGALTDEDGNTVYWITDNLNQVLGVKQTGVDQNTLKKQPGTEGFKKSDTNNEQWFDLDTYMDYVNDGCLATRSNMNFIKHVGRDKVYTDWIVTLSPALPLNEYQGRVMAEDLNAKQNSDFDFNDVVFDWKIESSNTVKILIKAAGGIYPLYVGDENHEVHALLGKTATDGKYPMINTGAGETGTAEPFIYTFTDRTDITIEDIAYIPIWVVIDGVRADLNFGRGKAACKFNTKPSTKWLKEYQDIIKGYPDFKDWVNDPDLDWTVNKDESYLYQ